jgi:hypothetical protein
VLLTAARRFGGNRSCVGHELGGGWEAAQITCFSYDAHGTQEADAAEGLQCLDTATWRELLAH